MMNVCFGIAESHRKEDSKQNDMEQKFLDFCSRRGIVGIKGYRTVGGFRVSLYNAMSESGVDVFIEAIKDFESGI